MAGEQTSFWLSRRRGVVSSVPAAENLIPAGSEAIGGVAWGQFAAGGARTVTGDQKADLRGNMTLEKVATGALDASFQIIGSIQFGVPVTVGQQYCLSAEFAGDAGGELAIFGVLGMGGEQIVQGFQPLTTSADRKYVAFIPPVSTVMVNIGYDSRNAPIRPVSAQTNYAGRVQLNAGSVPKPYVAT